jgi:ABC-type bacteriocin/lantibiotic exporter with double-glycine peptidase domain
MTTIKQYNDFACVAACFESIKKDLGDADFSHETFIRENSGLFNGGTEIEGSCSLENIPEVACRMGLECRPPEANVINLADGAVILYVWMGNSPDNKHCVRLAGFTGESVIIMDPNAAAMRDIPVIWVKGVFLIRAQQT